MGERGDNIMHHLLYISTALILTFILLAVVILIFGGFALFFFVKYKHYKRKMVYFISMVSHDLKSPIHGIRGYVTLSKLQFEHKDKVDEYLKTINNLSEHMEELINDLLDYSKIEKDKLELNRKPIQLGQLLDKCVLHIEPFVKLYDITFIKDFHVEHPLVLVDDLRLSQILINLLNNAVKYTKNMGKIIFAVTEQQINEDKSKYTFCIKDSGIGMSEEVLKHLYEPFASGKTNLHSELKSTGLGLFLVKEMVNLLQGEISMQSEEGKGSAFTISFVLDFCNEK